MNNSEIYSLLGFVKISETRTKALKSIGTGIKMPTEISKDVDVSIHQISSALKDLKDKNLVICTNEEATKGRLYKCTPMGLRILDCITK